MRKAGGIIALIAGIFGIFAAGITLLVGGIGSAVQADSAHLVVGLGWGGVAFSFIVIVLGAVGLLTFDTVWKGLLPPAWYLLLHLLEANLITPVLLGRRFSLNPVVIFVSLIFWTWLWGVPGALLSVPILVSIKVVCDRVPALSSVSELLASEFNSIFDNLKLRQLRKVGTSAVSSDLIS